MKPLALVIENDGGTRKLLDVLLTRSGLEVDLVSTGSDALVLLAHVRYDAVLVDLLLPGTSGMQVLDWMAREQPELLRRVTVLSSAPERQLHQVRQQWPEVRVIRKPFELGEVVEAVHGVIADVAERRPSPVETFCRASVRAGAKAGVVVRHGDPVELHLAFGYAPGEAESYFPLPIEAPLPICTAVRSATPVWLRSVAKMASEYAPLAPVLTRNDSRALAAVPLLRGGQAVGAVGWTFREPHLFAEDEQQVFLGIAAGLADDLAGRASSAAPPAP